MIKCVAYVERYPSYDLRLKYASEMFPLAFRIFLLSSLCSTVWNNINDCDETFNYLEPLGFIIPQVNNTGFQTWEYSPEFGLRSYFYLWFIGWPAYILSRFGLPGWLQFVSIRLYWSLISATSYASLVQSSSSSIYPYDESKKLTFGIIFSLIHSFAPGSFISVSSCVPSALAASVTALMLKTWINGQYFYSVGSVAFSAIALWPFSACLGVPLALNMILSGNIILFIISALFWAFALLVPMLLVDSYYYGGLVCPTWNIIAYNAFSSLKNHSLSQLYGTEPASYYAINYFLNFNIITMFVAVFTIPVSFYLIYKTTRSKVVNFHQRAFRLFYIATCPFVIWNLIFFTQAHKEERFLFPCYPAMELLATILLCVLFLNRTSFTFVTTLNAAIVTSGLAIFVALGFLRSVALVQGYSAPMHLVQHLPSSDQQKILCIGRDWHYFPSHFLLPRENHAWRVHFLRSNFSGQLPGKFSESGSVIDATRVPSSHFNDMNQPEQGTFFDVKKCDYILDRLSKPGQNEVQYSDDVKTWRVVLKRPILERIDPPMGSHKGTSVLHKALAKFQRAFYVPGLFTKNVWKEMHILERIKSL